MFFFFSSPILRSALGTPYAPPPKKKAISMHEELARIAADLDIDSIRATMPAPRCGGLWWPFQKWPFFKYILEYFFYFLLISRVTNHSGSPAKAGASANTDATPHPGSSHLDTASIKNDPTNTRARRAREVEGLGGSCV
jgi:hypothetical protein